nr:putative reverse transcriptase domain-containing protein [Tanacetum cinerariifolium]
DQARSQGNGRNQNGDAINDNIRGDVSRSCTYKEFLACNLKEYDGKGGSIVYTRWIEKIELVQDISRCRDNQKVKYTAGYFLVRLPRGATLKSTHKVEKTSDLGFSYEIEIASGQLVYIDKVIKGCRLEIDVHVFDIILIPFGSGSFDVIIKMDWLSNHKAEIICLEKVIKIPLLDGKVLRVLGEKPKEKIRQLMSTKAKEKKQEEIVVVRDFLEVFLDDLSGLAPIWEITFRIELVPRAILVAKFTYRLALFKLKELSYQLKELRDKGFIRPSSSPWGALIAGTLTDEALRNGPIKKNPEKRGNKGEPNKDRNVRDENKKTRTRNAYATTTNPVGRENTGGNRPNQALAINGDHGPGNQENQAKGRAFMLGAEEAL